MWLKDLQTDWPWPPSSIVVLATKKDICSVVEMTENRGGLLSESVSACPSQADGWQFFSPRDGFQPGEVNISCLHWAEEATRWGLLLPLINLPPLGCFSYHVHHHYHHQDVNHVKRPAYTIRSDGRTVDARFVFPDIKRNLNSSLPLPTVWWRSRSCIF